MKHLKKFNESFEQQMAREELQDFSETHLAYLLDDGYEIYVKEDRDSLLFALTIPSDISTEEDYDAGEFKWNDIKDHFIPFLIRLNNKYSVGIAQFFTNRNKTYEDRKSTRMNSSHITISYAVFCLKKKKKIT